MNCVLMASVPTGQSNFKNCGEVELKVVGKVNVELEVYLWQFLISFERPFEMEAIRKLSNNFA